MASDIIRTRRIHTGRVMELDADTVRFPNGTTGELDIVRHPGAAAVLARLDGGSDPDPELLLIRQYRHATGGYLLEIPAGRLNPGEAPADCAARELREETGYSARATRLALSIWTTPGFADERIHIFTATGLTKGESALETDEFITLEPVRLSKALELIRSGELSDAKTALAILQVAQFPALWATD